MTKQFTAIIDRWVVLALAISTVLTVGFTEEDPAEILLTVMLSGAAGLVVGFLLAWRAAHRYAAHRQEIHRVDHSHCTIVRPTEYIPPQAPLVSPHFVIHTDGSVDQLIQGEWQEEPAQRFANPPA